MPPFGLQGDETVQEMMKRVNAKTPAAQEGYLSNGKPRTTENVLELLELVKTGCPDGTDYLFGEDAPITMNREFKRLAAGDMIHIKAGGAERVLILTGVDQEAGTYTACELVSGEKINWSAEGTMTEFIDKPVTNVYSRW